MVNFADMEPKSNNPEAEAITAGVCVATYGETPHGGYKTLCYYFDESGCPCKENKAATLQILEFDKNNNCVFSLITEAE